MDLLARVTSGWQYHGGGRHRLCPLRAQGRASASCRLLSAPSVLMDPGLSLGATAPCQGHQATCAVWADLEFGCKGLALGCLHWNYWGLLPKMP